MTDLQASQAVTLAAGAFPAEGLNASQVMVDAVLDGGMDVRASQAVVLAAVRGRVSDPRVRAWTYSLDGHDFYVLKLGNIETLVCDLLTGEWSVWGSNTADLWRAYTGANWLGGRGIAANYGSNVIVGDDGNGSLYFLAPDEVNDDDAVVGADTPRPFERRVTGQMTITGGYASIPCYGVQLFGSAGNTDEDDLTVTLEISDDRGATFDSVGEQTVDSGDYSVRLNWQSLGSMAAPGRLFRITDYGAVQRIDSLQLEDGQSDDA